MCPEKNPEGDVNASGIKLPVQNNYEIAYKEAKDAFLKKNKSDIYNATGAKPDGDNRILLPFLNKEIVITLPDVIISYTNNAEVELWLKIILLHYLSSYEKIPFSGDQITYKQISGGLSYYPVFQKRCITPIISLFNGHYEKFIKAAEIIGGVRTDENKYSVSFQVFPHVRITYNIWEGDEELPADGNVAFDSSITGYLPSEDITVLCNMITVMIIKTKL